ARRAVSAGWPPSGRLRRGWPGGGGGAAPPPPGGGGRAVVPHIRGREPFRGATPPPPPDIDVKTLEHVRNDIGALNECWVRHLSGEPGSSVIARYRAITGKRREVLQGMSDGDWNAPTPTPAGMDSYGRFMRIRTFDCWMHEQDIRMALQRPSPDDQLDGPALRLSLDEIAAT